MIILPEDYWGSNMDGQVIPILQRIATEVDLLINRPTKNSSYIVSLSIDSMKVPF